MKTVEEVAAKLSGATKFSVIDASHAYWNVRLDEESSRLTTFNTPFGRYKFLRLPYGLKSSAEVFQKRMAQSFENVDGCDVIVDDILIWGKGDEEHDANLRQVLQRARQVNLKLNKSKSKLKLTEVPYIGHRLTQDGVKAGDDKIKPILDMPQQSYNVSWG